MLNIGGVFVDSAPEGAEYGYFAGYNATHRAGPGLTIEPHPEFWTMGTFRNAIQELTSWLSAIGAEGVFLWSVEILSSGCSELSLHGNSGQAAFALTWGILWENPHDWLLPLLRNVVVTGSLPKAEHPHGWDASIGHVGGVRSKLMAFVTEGQRLGFRMIAIPKSCQEEAQGAWQCRVLVVKSLEELCETLRAVFARAEFYRQATFPNLLHRVASGWHFSVLWSLLALVAWLLASQPAVLLVPVVVLFTSSALKLSIWLDEQRFRKDERQVSGNRCETYYDPLPENWNPQPELVIDLLKHMKDLQQSLLSSSFRKWMLAQLKVTGWWRKARRGWDIFFTAIWLFAVAYLGICPDAHQLAERVPWGGDTMSATVCWHTAGGQNCGIPPSGIGKSGFLNVSIPHKHGVQRRLLATCSKCYLSPADAHNFHSSVVELGEGGRVVRIDYHDLSLPQNEFSFQFDLTLLSYEGDEVYTIPIPVRWNPEVDPPPITARDLKEN